MHAYADQHLGNHRCGSSRCTWVFKLGKKKLALKIARPVEGAGGGPIKQNKTEVNASECVKGSDNFTHVIKFDPRFQWIVAELADVPFDTDNFEKYTGIPWYQFDRFSSSGVHGLESLMELYPDSDWLPELIKDVEACGIEPLDFHDQNWGQADGRPVVLDYGFTDDDADGEGW